MTSPLRLIKCTLTGFAVSAFCGELTSPLSDPREPDAACADTP
jgi:hypothetical protein